MKKRVLSWLLALTMLLTLAPQTLPVWASATGEKSNTATQTESKLSANTYSALGLSRDVNTSALPKGQQPYGKAEPGNTVATNVINELYVNFNGSIHYGWSILDNLTMQYKTNISDWNSSENFYGAMAYWRYGQQRVSFKYGDTSLSALFAKDENGRVTVSEHNETINGNKSSSISSANKHLVYQYSKSEAFSPNTGKDNYVAELVVSDDGMVSLYIYQVEGGNKRYVRGTNIGKNPYVGDANDKTNIIWNWEYDAMFDIAAGDMDGDGYDEIAVYTTNQVYVYSYKNNILSSPITRGTKYPTGYISDDKTKKLGTAVVTLAFGDINADDKEELIIAESLPYGCKNIADGEVGIYALDNNTLSQKWSNKLYDGNKYVRYANVSTGDIDGDYKDELIIAGYQSTNDEKTTCSNSETGTISYMIVKGSKYTTSGWKTADQKIDLLRRVVDNKEQLIPPVSLTCAATQGVGYAEQVFLGGCLYTVNSDNSLKYLTRISTNREYKKDNGNKANKNEIFVVNVVAGNFNGNRNGQEQIVYAFGMKHDDSDRYWYDIGYINKKEPGDTNANSSSGYWYGQEQVMNYESSYNRDQNKSRASLYLSLAAVDCDKDSTLMRYKGQTVTWTKPEVLTVLQSAPYFQDLEDTRGYINQGQTGYGKGKGSGSSATAGTSLSVGTYVSFEQDFSVFGVKIASIQAEAQTKHSFNYGYEHNQTVETEVNYSGSAGDDYAVVYAVPYMEYQYETWVPGYTLPNDETEYNKYLDNYLEGKLGKTAWATADKNKERAKAEKELGIHKGMPVQGSWQPCTVSVPMTPRTVMLSVDDYDDIANVTEGLQPIRGNILNSTPGDPTTYDVVDKREGFNKIGTLQTVTKAQGSNISVTQTATTEEEHSFEYEYEFEAKVGAGAGGLTVGVLAGFGANAGGGISTSTSKSYSATVDNLPSDADGYTLSWQFGWRKAKLNNNDVLVLEYQQKDTKAKPSPPKNLRVESVTSNSVTLTWDPVTGAGAYKIYQVERSNNGKLDLFPMEKLAGTATSWTDEGLSSNTNYIYVAQTITQSGEQSITSTQVNASTLEAQGGFKITKQPRQEDATTYAGGTVSFSVEAECRDTNNNLKDLHYQWQVYDKQEKEWKPLSDGENSTYHATVNEQNNGDRYRCRVYRSASLYLYSTEVTLKIDRAASLTAWASTPNDTVKSTYFITKEEEVRDEKGNLIYADVPEVVDGRTKYSYQSGNQTQYVYVATTGSAGEEVYHYYPSSNDATEITQVEQEVLTFGDESYNITRGTSGTVPAGKKYTVAAGTGDVTSSVEYVPTEVYNLTLDRQKVDLYHYFNDDTTDPEEFWFVEVTEGGQLKQYVADVEKVKKLKIDDNTLIDISSLTVCTEKSTDPATTTVQKKQAGDTVKLTVNVADATTGNHKIPTGSVTFKVVNTTGDGGFTKDVEIKDGKAEISWNPTTSGVYTVTAIYSGSDIFKESQSQIITINVVTPGEKKLVVSGGNMTYGESQTLKATLFEGGSASGTTNVSTTDVSNNVTYTVMRDGTDVTNQNELSSSGTFTPKQAGTYTITASYTDPSAAGQAEGESGKANNVITSTKVITVNRKTVKIVPKVNANKSITYDLPNIPEADKTAIRDAIDTSCIGLADGAKAGIYPIVVTYKGDTTIDKKYLIICDNDQKYEVKGDVVQVTNATTDSNGKVKLQYTDNKGNTYDVGENGQTLDVPKGVTLTATAMPNVGYRVEKWTEKVGDNTEALIFSSTDVYNTSNVITKEDLQTKYSIKADFTLTYYNLKMGFATGGSGSIIAKYLNDAGTEGAIFYDSNSPSLTPTTATQQLSPLKKVRITATPAAGRVISGWKIYSGTDSEGILVKNDDGTTYTGNTYTVSSINANTKIEIQTETKAAKTIKVTLVGQDGANLGSQASVSFNGGAATISEDGNYTYSTAQHDNVVINLTVPDSLIVDSWKIGDTEQNVGTLSNNKKTLSISDLQLTADSLELTVHCKAPNSYPVTVTQKIGETTVTDAADITIKKNGTDDTVNWSSSDDNKVPEATILRVIIQEKDGYELQSVSCNGEEQTTQDTEGGKAFTINGVHAGVNIVATFKELAPYTVTFSVSDTGGGANGTLSATAERKGKAYDTFGNGSTVYEGATVTFTAEPADGYRVKEWQVDGSVYEDAATNTTLTLTPTENTNVTVQFTPIGDTATFSTGENGRITSVKLGEQEVPNFAGGFVLTPGASIEVTAEPAAGYEVEQWLVNGVKQSETGNTLTYTAKETGSVGAAISVSFRQVKYSVTWGGTHGTVAVAGYDGNQADIRGGTDVTFTATPANGYKFDHWTVNETEQTETSTTFTWTVPNGKAETPAVNEYNIQAVCVPDTQSYTVTYAAEAPENGTVTTPGGSGGSITVAAGTNLTFTAHPNQYYHVKTWKLDGNPVDGSANQNTYTLSNVAGDHIVTVVFDKAVSYTVGYQVEGGNGTLKATKNGTDLNLEANQTEDIPAGSKLVFTAVPATGEPNYMVEKWIVNNRDVTRTNMEELGVTMEHYLSNTLTIDSLDRNVTVKVQFTTYSGVSIPTGGTGYTITTDKRIPAETYTGASTSEIRKNGDLTFTVQPNKTSDKNYNAITKLVVNGYDCIAKSGTATNCDSLEAVKNANGSYTITIRNIEALTINADTHQLVIGDLTVPTAFEGNDELNTVEKIKAKLETRLTARKDGTAFYDIVLKAVDGTIISGDNFPANGVDVVLPYPTGTDSKDDFRIVHMLTTGANAGDIQNVRYTKESNGLHFHVDSLSPFGVSWVKYVAPTPGGGGGGGGGVVSTYTLTFDTNGGSAIDKITKDSGTTIDLAAYKPTRAGYTFAGWFSDKALTKAVTSVKLTANTTVYAKWTQNGGTAQNPFVDVKEGAYYYDAVLWAVEQKITSGTSATTFSPDASCTRAQMVTFLWRAAGSPKVENGKNPFADVKADAYYYDAVLWAVEKGVTSGTSATTFSPDATVTRGQTVTFLYRNAGSPEVSGTMPFTDVEADAYYAKAVQWAVQQKITTGTSETTFSPMSDCTRGQIVTFLYRAK